MADFRMKDFASQGMGGHWCPGGNGKPLQNYNVEAVMHRVVALGFIVAGIFVTLMACSPQQVQTPAKSEPEVYKLGATFPMTGPGSGFGEFFRNGSQLAIDEINAAGGIKGHKLELIIEDHKVDPPTGITAFRKLVEVDRVPLVLITFTNVGLAQLPVANETKTVAFTAAMITPGLDKQSEWVFRNTVGADLESQRMAAYIYNERRLTKIGTVYQNTDAGLAGARAFKEAFEKLGGRVVAEESYEIGATDLRAQLSKLRAAGVEGIYQAGRGQEMGLLLKQADEMGFKVAQFANTSMELPEALQVAGSAAEGVVYTVGAYDPEASKEFVANYKARFGSEPDIFAGNHYDAIKMIARAIETNGYTAAGIREGLKAIKDFPGVTGKTSFDGRQEAVKELSLKVIKDGKPQLLKFGG